MEQEELGLLARGFRDILTIRRKVGNKEYTVEEIVRFHINEPNSKWNYGNPAIILIDIVLSINRPYLTFVQPRIKRILVNFPRLNSLEGLKKLLKKQGEVDFCKKVWDYNHGERYYILKNLCDAFLKYKTIHHIKEDLQAMKHWAINLNLKKLKNNMIKVKGIGISSIQYLRMLLGVNTIMPDRHIKSFLEETLKKKVSNTNQIVFLEKMSQTANIPAMEIIEAIWAAKNPVIVPFE